MSLFRRGWLAQQPRAALLIVHGFAEHSGRYEHVGSQLAAAGLAVHAYDQLGHGRSSGRRGHVRRFDDYLDDAERMIALVRAEHPGLPLFLLGHSMGGLVTAALARERRPEVRGIALSGAALCLARPLPIPLWALRALRLLAPRHSRDAEIDPNALSTDPEVGRAYLADPLVFRQMTISLSLEFVTAARRTAPGGADVAVPLLALHGGDDPICRPEGSERFAAAAPQGRFVLYPGLRHEILNEPRWRDVLADLEAWIDECLQTGRAAAG